MIYFFADDHFGSRPGFKIYEQLKDSYKIRYHENLIPDDCWPAFGKDCSLLILNMIAETGTTVCPGKDGEKALYDYCTSGGNLFLIHGSSAAFWPWDWWRKISGLRWVRQNDPDGVEASWHPVRPYEIVPSKTRHPLMSKLMPIKMPNDEIYVRLEQTSPITILMEAKIEEGTFPMLYETKTEWGGKVIGFLPGHNDEALYNPDFIKTISNVIDYLKY